VCDEGDSHCNINFGSFGNVYVVSVLRPCRTAHTQVAARDDTERN